MACPESRRLARGERLVRCRASGAFGVATFAASGWVNVLWDDSQQAGPVDYYGPATAGWLEVL